MQFHTQKFDVANRRTVRSSSGKALAAVVFAASALILPALTGCGQSFTKITKHGHQFRATDAQLVQPGMSREDVRLSLGTPTTTSRRSNGEAFYYISSTTSQMAFLSPKEIDRRVFAVYFDELGSVQRIANYGLKDGRVFDFISRSTPSAGGQEEGFVGQMFKNLGRRGSLFGQ